jgi:hypothetical protein
MAAGGCGSSAAVAAAVGLLVCEAGAVVAHRSPRHAQLGKMWGRLAAAAADEACACRGVIGHVL